MRDLGRQQGKRWWFWIYLTNQRL